MKTINPVDAARVELLLADLRLPAIKLMWTKLAEQSDKEGWPAARFLAALAEHEIADRGRRRIERHLAEARLPVGKTFDSFDFEVVPMVSKAQVMALTSGDSWLEKGANLLLLLERDRELVHRGFERIHARRRARRAQKGMTSSQFRRQLCAIARYLAPQGPWAKSSRAVWPVAASAAR